MWLFWLLWSTKGTVKLQEQFETFSPLRITAIRLVHNKNNNNHTSDQASPYLSPWISRTFGDLASFRSNFSDDVTFKQMQKSFQKSFAPFVKESIFPASKMQPLCAVEVLGNVLLSLEEPFIIKGLKPGRMENLVAGNAYFSYQSFVHNNHNNNNNSNNGTYQEPWRLQKDEVDRSDMVECVFRAVYETWTPHNYEMVPNFWSLLFYCPIHASNTKHAHFCQQKRQQEQEQDDYKPFQMFVDLDHSTWVAPFNATLHPSTVVTSLLPSTTQAKTKQLVATKAICLVQPYSSSKKEIAMVMDAMLAEFIHHHASLGFTVFFYDADGEHQHRLQNSSYIQEQRLDVSSVIYFNYTIRTRLDSYRHQFDNTMFREGSPPALRHGARIDHDKTLTLTQCRWEINTLFPNIDAVLVVDADEFLYCPQAGASVTQQRRYIDDYFASLKEPTDSPTQQPVTLKPQKQTKKVKAQLRKEMKRNPPMQPDQLPKQPVDQLEMLQNIVSPKTPSPDTCMFGQVNQSLSLLECFNSVKFPLVTKFPKSIHLSNVCPLTDFHYSCKYRAWDYGNNCLCRDMLTPVEQCSFIHLSTNVAKYVNLQTHNLTHPMYQTTLELLSMRNRSSHLNTTSYENNNNDKYKYHNKPNSFIQW